ncbi:MAG TPA: hypothetical protein VGW74_11810 [Propionibacteriaceae bacterium]|nr:hypothetical protein [Propionibacteriaceae bacterium]
MTYEDCPDRTELRTFDGKPVRYLCGCGHCPVPDPTPRELHARVDREWIADNLALAGR